MFIKRSKMRKRKMEKEPAGQRKSARISALEEKAKEKAKQHDEEEEEEEENDDELELELQLKETIKVNKRKGRKRKRKRSLQDVVLNSVASPPADQLQEGENLEHEEINKTNPDQPSGSRAPLPMSKKQTLQFLLDMLQMKDKDEAFAQPVNPDEVLGYYNKIKEPMDFGTMRAKLQEELYTSLEQFKHDVYLIYSNAMKYFSSTSPVFKSACAIRKLARWFFNSLRSEPKAFEWVCKGRRRCTFKNSEAELVSTNSTPTRQRGGRGATNTASRRKRCTQPSLSPHSPSSSRRNLNENLRSGLSRCPTGRRTTYLRPNPAWSRDISIFSPLENVPKVLSQVSTTSISSYEKSLRQFIADLGPTAQEVADKKLRELYQIEAALNMPSPPPTSPFPFHEDIDLNSVNKNQNFNSFGPGFSEGELISTNELLNVVSSSSRRPNLSKSSSGGINFSNPAMTGGLNLNFPNSADSKLNFSSNSTRGELNLIIPSSASRGLNVSNSTTRVLNFSNLADPTMLLSSSSDHGIVLPNNFLSGQNAGANGGGLLGPLLGEMENFPDAIGVGCAYPSLQNLTATCESMDPLFDTILKLSEMKNDHDHSPSGACYPLTGNGDNRIKSTQIIKSDSPLKEKGKMKAPMFSDQAASSSSTEQLKKHFVGMKTLCNRHREQSNSAAAAAIEQNNTKTSTPPPSAFGQNHARNSTPAPVAFEHNNTTNSAPAPPVIGSNNETKPVPAPAAFGPFGHKNATNRALASVTFGRNTAANTVPFSAAFGQNNVTKSAPVSVVFGPFGYNKVTNSAVAPTASGQSNAMNTAPVSVRFGPFGHTNSSLAPMASGHNNAKNINPVSAAFGLFAQNKATNYTLALPALGHKNTTNAAPIPAAFGPLGQNNAANTSQAPVAFGPLRHNFTTNTSLAPSAFGHNNATNFASALERRDHAMWGLNPISTLMQQKSMVPATREIPFFDNASHFGEEIYPQQAEVEPEDRLSWLLDAPGSSSTPFMVDNQQPDLALQL